MQPGLFLVKCADWLALLYMPKYLKKCRFGSNSRSDYCRWSGLHINRVKSFMNLNAANQMISIYLFFHQEIQKMSNANTAVISNVVYFVKDCKKGLDTSSTIWKQGHPLCSLIKCKQLIEKKNEMPYNSTLAYALTRAIMLLKEKTLIRAVQPGDTGYRRGRQVFSL